MGSNTTVEMNFSLCNSGLFYVQRSATQPNTKEINREIHLANTLF